MNAYPAGDTRLPSIASIPDPRTEGVRSYREPAEPHPLQLAFLEPEGESAWVEEMRALLAAGRADEAGARLDSELAGFQGAIARLCKSTATANVAVEGWEDLLPILAEWEGPPVTGVTLGLTNPPDLVFEPGRPVEPELMLGLFSDDAYPFSRASEAELLAESAKDCPDWVGAEEDVEFYCSLTGLADLNTALVHCKHRYFLRDGRDGVEGRAPGGYVEFVLGSWFLATRFLQAAQRVIDGDRLPEGCRLIAGTVGIGADFVTVLGCDRTSASASSPRAVPAQPAFATLSMKPWVPREDPAADAPAKSPTFRQRIAPAEPVPAPVPSRAFLGRLLERFRRG